MVRSILRRVLVGRGPITRVGALRSWVTTLVPVDVGLDLIRVGGANDGGYVIPDDLQGVGSCFSAGVGTVASFEADLLARGIRPFLVDGSVDGPPSAVGGADFLRMNLGTASTESTITLDDWVRTRCPAPDEELLLQMDIEGAEYECLLSTSETTLRRFRILVVEFHGLTGLVRRPFFDLVQAATRALLTSFDVVHLHPNNCSRVRRVGGVSVPDVLEITLLRKDRGGERTPVRRRSHPLDAKNDPNGRHVELSGIWLGE
jgi:methyltransferase FkbM-like protein